MMMYNKIKDLSKYIFVDENFRPLYPNLDGVFAIVISWIASKERFHGRLTIR